MADLINVDVVREAARGRWDSILRAAGMADSYLNKKHGPCPICQAGKDRWRWSNQDDRGTWICNACGTGDGFTLLQKYNGWDFIQSVRWVAQFLGLAAGAAVAGSGPDPAETERRRREEAAARAEKWAKARADNLRLWQQAVSIERGSPVGRYLLNRGLVLDAFPAVLRFHPAVPYWDKNESGKLVKLGEYPALLACVQSPEGFAIALHKTHLTIHGQKATVPSVKKWTAASGEVAGSAVRLFPAGPELAIAEGLETALACHLASGLPVWSALSANGLAAVVLPECVRAVYVMADNDSNQTGQLAAEKLAGRLRSEGREVRVLIPARPDSDWLDVYASRAANDAEHAHAGRVA